MKSNEEYPVNRTRDWVVFIASFIFMIVLLLFKPEWIWVSFPSLFTSLGGAMGRL